MISFQPWPCFLICLPFCSVIVSFISVFVLLLLSNKYSIKLQKHLKEQFVNFNSYRIHFHKGLVNYCDYALSVNFDSVLMADIVAA